MSPLKPFNAIPGPKALPLIGTLHKYLPLIGPYSFKRLHRNGLLKYLEFGPLVREKVINGVELLFVFDPDDIERVFANDGQFPYRRSHTALQKYRLDRPNKYACGGLIPTNGEEWWRLRKESQRVMTRLQCVKSHLPVVNEICADFVNVVGNETNSENEIEDFLPLLKKLFLECLHSSYLLLSNTREDKIKVTMQTTVDFRFHCFKSREEEGEASQLMWAADASTKSILSTDNGIPFWRWFNTPLYKQLTRSQDTIYRIALKYVDAKRKVMQEPQNSNETSTAAHKTDDELTMLEYFIRRSNLNQKDILTIVCDALLAGADTSSFTSAFMLYHLAMNPEKQEKLAEEAKNLLKGSGGLITDSVLREARYTKAVVKESMRLNPVSVGVGRIATTDFALKGYHIPKKTIIVTQNQVSCRMEKYFRNANNFIPERWIEKNSRPKSPFLVLPFGHGPRACIGRRLAEQNIFCFLLQMSNAFHISWKGCSDLDCYSHLINEPDSNLHLKFIKRT